jgi:hypothetical protein
VAQRVADEAGEDDVEIVAAGGQHDDRGIAAAAQPTAYLEAVEARQHHIEYHDIHGGLADAIQRRLTGFGEAHLIAEAAQSQFQDLPGGWIVLD